jgi:hypothetical protein
VIKAVATPVKIVDFITTIPPEFLACGPITGKAPTYHASALLDFINRQISPHGKLCLYWNDANI